MRGRREGREEEGKEKGREERERETALSCINKYIDSLLLDCDVSVSCCMSPSSDHKGVQPHSVAQCCSIYTRCQRCCRRYEVHSTSMCFLTFIYSGGLNETRGLIG